MSSKPFPQQPHRYPAELLRQTLLYAVGDAGILGAGSLKVTQRAAGANMTVDVAAGRAVIPGISGNYIDRLTTFANVAIAAKPSVGNSRIDRVYFEVRDAQATTTGSDQDGVVGVATGTQTGGTPALPSIPTYAIELARITLTNSTNSILDSDIADCRRHSASPGDRVWPDVDAVGATDSLGTGSSVVNYGLVTIPPPNRPVTVSADVNCNSKCATGQTLGVVNVRLRVESTGVTGSFNGAWKEGLSTNEQDPIPLSQSGAWLVEPDRGTPILVRGQVRSRTGGTADFTEGGLRVSVVPAF